MLKQISGIVGVTTVTRDNNDMVLYTSDGVTLFETIPRAVTFKPTQSYGASTDGNGVYIDGVALGKGSGGTTSAQGSLQALLQLRDDVAPTFQSQLDEIAQGLVASFSETNTAGTSTLPGLFTWTLPSGLPGGTPTTATIIDGIAGSITVNPAVVTSLGGDPMKLRDGSINGACVQSEYRCQWRLHRAARQALHGHGRQDGFRSGRRRNRLQLGDGYRLECQHHGFFV